MDRRTFLLTTGAGGALAATGSISCAPGEPDAPAAAAARPASFELDETTIATLQEGMDSGRWTARGITELYLRRIEAVDRSGPTLRSVIETNPDALAIAEELDRERRASGPRGPLHGIPVLVKDNVATADRMTTTAGSLALEGSIPPEDSFVARRLREAGAVVLAKANLSEWANFRSTRSSSGWSARGGQCRNPYVLDRNPCGSSSGTGAGVSANLAAVGIGTETDGSIVCPSHANGLVGIKPTVGLVSRSRIIPISHTQDTAGPMARTVRDAAVLLGALTGVDPGDPATRASEGNAVGDYTDFLDPGGLAGARIGVARAFFGFDPGVDALMETSIETMRGLGAEIVDPVDLSEVRESGDAEYEVLLYEFKADMAAYLEGLGPSAPARSLADLIRFNEANADREMPYFGQEIFEQAEAKGPLTDTAYREALERSTRAAGRDGIDRVVSEHGLDAIVAPTGGPAWTTDLVNGDHFTGGSSSAAARAGYPNVTVPMGFVFGLPVGISIFGLAWSEGTLIRIAYAFEQATNVRRAPTFLPTLELG